MAEHAPDDINSFLLISVPNAPLLLTLSYSMASSRFTTYAKDLLSEVGVWDNTILKNHFSGKTAQLEDDKFL